MTEPERSFRVLVADDEPVMCTLMRSVLEQDGHQVEEAYDGESALVQLAAFQPDLLVLDVRMPGTDGLEVCRRLRADQRWRDLPVLVATGDSDTESTDAAFAAGATDFITKPLQPSLLQRRVRFMIRASESAAALRQAHTELAKSEGRLANAQRIARVGSWEWDPGGRFVEVSEGFLGLVGRREGQGLMDVVSLVETVHPDERGRVEAAIQRALEKGEASSLEHRLASANGSEPWVRHEIQRLDADGGVLLAGTIQDTSDRKRAEKEITRLAYYDGLTGLANRQLMTQHLSRALGRAVQLGKPLSVLFIDVDRFKRINDSLGHAAGDRVLLEVGERLLGSVRVRDWVGRGETSAAVSRIGGDEFIVVLTETQQPEDVAIVARRITEALREPVRFEGHEIRVTASIGIAVAPGDGDDPETLLASADLAMYEAKKRGRGHHLFHNPELGERLRRSVLVEERLRRALADGKLRFDYQPIVRAGGGATAMVEALARWTDDELGVVNPVEFIEIAEESGLIIPLGRWALREGCRQLRQWQEEAGVSVGMSINVSPLQLRSPDFTETVRLAIEEHQLDPRRIDLEITEGIFIDVDDALCATLSELKRIGVGLVVDDFGTGYCSLRYLQRMSIDGLKIDRFFVNAIEQDSDGAALVSAILSMAQRLGLFTVAEGVEDEDQEAFLVGEHCDLLQGYYYAKPMPPEQALQQILDRE